MVEGNSKEISKFDALVAGIKRATNRAKREGRTVPATPAINTHLERKKREAGSPSPEKRE